MTANSVDLLLCSIAFEPLSLLALMYSYVKNYTTFKLQSAVSQCFTNLH